MAESQHSADSGEEVLAALSAVVTSLRECSDHINEARERAEMVFASRRSGASYAEILGSADTPLVLELLTSILSAVSDTGSKLRRAEARALYAEGLSMEKIARIFGVSRQRVSSLLQPTAIESQMVRGPDRRRGGLAFTDPEFRMIAEAVPHIVWVAAPDGSVEYVNTQAADFIGGPREIVYDSNWVDVVHPDDAERAVAGWAEAVRSCAPYELEYRLRRADGEWRWHAVRALPWRGPDGQVAKWVGTATDIEDHKRLEAELRDRN